MEEKSYYEILGVDKAASITQIKKKYFELAKKYHPDKVPIENREECSNKFKEISEAYEVLSNEEKRSIYNQFGKQGLSQSNMPDVNFQNIFTQFFNSFSQPSKIKSINISVDVTLEEIYTGKCIQQEIEYMNTCSSCKGSGSDDNKKSTKCEECHGQGFKLKTVSVQGTRGKSIQQCSTCEGKGTVIKNKCKTCHGEAYIAYNKTVKVDIPPGMNHGEYIILKEGHCIDQEQGDVCLIINQLPHALFSRKRENLGLTLEISLHEALCGFTKCFTHVDGNIYWIDSHDIISETTVKIMKEYGLPIKNKENHYGDLFIKFKIQYPTKLSDSSKIILYTALTGEKYNSKQIHSIPEDKQDFVHYL